MTNDEIVQNQIMQLRSAIYYLREELRLMDSNPVAGEAARKQGENALDKVKELADAIGCSSVRG